MHRASHGERKRRGSNGGGSRRRIRVWDISAVLIITCLALICVYEMRLLHVGVAQPIAGQIQRHGRGANQSGIARGQGGGTAAAAGAAAAAGGRGGLRIESAAHHCYRRIQMGTQPSEIIAPYPYMNHSVDVRVLRDMHELAAISTAQAHQDVWIAEHVDEASFHNGTFVEFGARDGVSDSNTYALELGLGWRGVLIEASREEMHDIRHNRPRSLIYNALVCPSYLTNATFAKSHLPGWGGVQMTLNREHSTEIDHSENMQCLHLNEVMKTLRMHGVTFMSIDVEGFEVPILADFDFHQANVSYVQVERNVREAEDLCGVLDLFQVMTRQGFILVHVHNVGFLAYDLVFRRVRAPISLQEEKRAFATSPYFNFVLGEMQRQMMVGIASKERERAKKLHDDALKLQLSYAHHKQRHAASPK